MSVAARAVHGINVCVIPSPYNDDRPLALRHRSLATVSGALLAVKLLAALAIAFAPTPAELSVITTNRIIQLTNAERQKGGLSALTTNSQLTAAAQEKCKHMLEEDYFAHISPSGVTPWFWIKKHGYTYQVAGENLAIDFTEAEDVVAAWMASPSHKANIMHSEYTETGVAVVSGEFQGGTSIVVVHMFGLPAGATAPSSTPVPTSTPATAGTQQKISTPTPSPTTTPLPTTPTAVPPSPSAVPLRTPRIALAGTATAGATVLVSIEGEGNSAITVLANGQAADTINLPPTGQATAAINISSIPDGAVVLRAYASGFGRQSELSEGVAITKDTTGPALAFADLSFVISPAFDTAQAAVSLPSVNGSQSIQLIDIRSTETLEARDEHGNVSVVDTTSLKPSFEETAQSAELRAPQRLLQVSRHMSVVVLIVLLVLLSMAIIIRIHVQHPALIMHASLAILLSSVLFLI
ncbi:MAG: hypothetical protein HYR90_04470 [Candidatus Andersenbacteria bacterium]|nr:hypothetical protein [Candidatus Andersenbacteria bacterium]MBI3250473.1 hypothetical protein [Candidatus Andersenbacteria bacterium]